MERPPKLKNKLSYSPTRTPHNLFTMRARIASKHHPSSPTLPLHLNYQNMGQLSPSVSKAKGSRPKLFSGAHQIDSKETYLLKQRVQ
jgi:hypothetical protein